MASNVFLHLYSYEFRLPNTNPNAFMLYVRAGLSEWWVLPMSISARLSMVPFQHGEGPYTTVNPFNCNFCVLLLISESKFRLLVWPSIPPISCRNITLLTSANSTTWIEVPESSSALRGPCTVLWLSHASNKGLIPFCLFFCSCLSLVPRKTLTLINALSCILLLYYSDFIHFPQN